jgi:hypothetical protein
MTTYLYLGAGALLLVGLAWIVAKGPANAGKSAGRAIVGGASDLAGGLVQGGLSVLGVAETDADKCQACIAARDWWGVSKYCPAATAAGAGLDALLGRGPSSSVDADAGASMPPAITPPKSDWENRLEGVWL